VAANPLLNAQPGQRIVEFDKVELGHFKPALEGHIERARAQIEKIKSEPASFNNTIVALASAFDEVAEFGAIFASLSAANGDQAMHQLNAELMPKISAFDNDVNLDKLLFAKVEEVYKTAKGLTPEETELLRRTYRNMVRNGAGLNDEAKAELRKIDQELSRLGPKFHENNVRATNDFALILSKPEEIAGLPESVLATAKQAAKEKGYQDSYLFTLHFPSANAFLKYADNRNLREVLSKAYSGRCFGGPSSNLALVRKIVKLRQARAKLLGFASHAHFQLEERMAKTPEAVQEFLAKLKNATIPGAEREFAELQEFATKECGLKDKIQAWDWQYYAEKLRQKKYNFSEEEARQYFALNDVIKGIFTLANKLYGLCFEKKSDVPVYHPEVEVYDVSDSSGHVGLLYTDHYPRATKGQGAWCTKFRRQSKVRNQRPHVSIVCNLNRPTGDKPALLTLNEVRTMFHEFGHALHHLLSDCTYASLSGTNVFTDFVELPSQVLENWILERPMLDLFAKHHETGQPVPEKLFQGMKAAAKFQAGLQMLRQLKFGLLDMGFHAAAFADAVPLAEFELEKTKGADLFPAVKGTCIATSFSHLFSGGYSAGYYSYKWAEVLDADTFEAFQEKGLFDKDVATRFRQNVLSRGGTEHPMELYKRFRGREPDPNALLRRYDL
jgi:peptidyl-dipeptidase Dcp